MRTLTRNGYQKPPNLSHDISPVSSNRPQRREYKPFSGFLISVNTNIESLANLYGLTVAPTFRVKTVKDYIAETLRRQPLTGDRVALGCVDLIVFARNDSIADQVVLDLALRTPKPKQKHDLDVAGKWAGTGRD